MRVERWTRRKSISFASETALYHARYHLRRCAD